MLKSFILLYAYTVISLALYRHIFHFVLHFNPLIKNKTPSLNTKRRGYYFQKPIIYQSPTGERALFSNHSFISRQCVWRTCIVHINQYELNITLSIRFYNIPYTISSTCSVTFLSLSTPNALNTGLSLSIRDTIIYTAVESYASLLSSSEGLEGVSGCE